MCGAEFSGSEFVRFHIRDVHGEELPPTPQEYYNGTGTTWKRKAAQ